MEKLDATWKNIENILNKVSNDIGDAEYHAKDAINATENAYEELNKLKKLMKIRKEYEGNLSESQNWFDKTDLANEFIKLIETKLKGKG